MSPYSPDENQRTRALDRQRSGHKGGHWKTALSDDTFIRGGPLPPDLAANPELRAAVFGTLASTPEERDLIRAATMKKLGWREQTASSKSARKRMAIRRKQHQRKSK